MSPLAEARDRLRTSLEKLAAAEAMDGNMGTRREAIAAAENECLKAMSHALDVLVETVEQMGRPQLADAS